MTATTQIRHVETTDAETQAAICAYLNQNATGGWIVRDEADTRGGLFQNRKAALKFVRNEFGREARIITEATPQRLH